MTGACSTFIFYHDIAKDIPGQASLTMSERGFLYAQHDERKSLNTLLSLTTKIAEVASDTKSIFPILDEK